MVVPSETHLQRQDGELNESRQMVCVVHTEPQR